MEKMTMTVTLRTKRMAVVKAMLSISALASPLLPSETVLKVANLVLRLLRLEMRTVNGPWTQLNGRFEVKPVDGT